MRARLLLYFLLIISVGTFVRILPALLYSYPLGGETGYFFAHIKAILENGFRRPLLLPYYGNGVPFAFPPLTFFIYALIHKLTSISLMNLLRFLPSIISSACIPAFYFLSREFFEEKKALFATFAYSLMPASFWDVGNSGGVRFLGILLLIFGVLSYLRYLKYEKRTNLLLAGVSLGLIISVHPISALHLFMIYFILFLIFAHRKYRQELCNFLAIFGIGAVVSAPYWTFVLRNFGFLPFYNVATLHVGTSHIKGSGNIFLRLFTRMFLRKWTVEEYIHIGSVLGMSVLGMVGFLICLIRGARIKEKNELFLLFWAIILIFSIFMTIFMIRPKQLAPPFSLLATIGFFDFAIPGLKKIVKTDSRMLTVMVIILLGIIGLSDAISPSAFGDNKIVPSINDKNIEAMRWLKDNTQENSTVLVIGNGETWVPVISERRCFGVHTGPKWAGNRKALHFYSELYHGTESLREFTELLKKYNVRPSYIYISNYPNSVHLNRQDSVEKLWGVFVYSHHFKSVFKNKNTQIFKVSQSIIK